VRGVILKHFICFQVIRDIFYSGNAIEEKATIIMRVAPTFLRFGSFQIALPEDEFTGT